LSNREEVGKGRVEREVKLVLFRIGRGTGIVVR